MTRRYRALMERRPSPLKHTLFCFVVAAVVLFVYVCIDVSRQFWEGYRPSLNPLRYFVAYPGNYRFVLDEARACRSGAPFLLLMVPVAPHDAAARDAIRQTWGGERQVLGRRVETVFVLGLPSGADAGWQQEALWLEARHHGDLIQSDFLDSYRNLTIKTMVTLEWLASRCANASFAAKVDSDVFLHVRNLVRMLLDPCTVPRDLMTGLVWWHSTVLRNPFSKFYVPWLVFPEAEYPPYPLGMAYVMSMDLPRKILKVAPQIRPIYIEDAYLGMCLRRLGVEPREPPANAVFLVTPQHPVNSCSLANVVAMTTTNIPQMMDYWKTSWQPTPHCNATSGPL